MITKEQLLQYHSEYNYYSFDYGELLALIFDEIVIQVDTHGYQGDSLVFGIKDGLYCYLVFGWGSCSGCDALQACDSLDEVLELANELDSSRIIFDDLIFAKNWFINHDWQGDFVDDELKQEFCNSVLEWIKEHE